MTPLQQQVNETLGALTMREFNQSAAAPDMYDALMAVLDAQTRLPVDVLVQVENALAKAEGREPILKMEVACNVL